MYIPVPIPLLNYRPGRLFSHVLHLAQAQQHRAVARSALNQAEVHAGVEEWHPKPAGVLLDGLHRVKPHGLAVHQGDEELQRVMAFEPRRLVGSDRESMGVRLGEHVVTVDLVEYPVGNINGDAVGERPL